MHSICPVELSHHTFPSPVLFGPVAIRSTRALTSAIWHLDHSSRLVLTRLNSRMRYGLSWWNSGAGNHSSGLPIHPEPFLNPISAKILHFRKYSAFNAARKGWDENGSSRFPELIAMHPFHRTFCSLLYLLHQFDVILVSFHLAKAPQCTLFGRTVWNETFVYSQRRVSGVVMHPGRWLLLNQFRA